MCKRALKREPNLGPTTSNTTIPKYPKGTDMLVIIQTSLKSSGKNRRERCQLLLLKSLENYFTGVMDKYLVN
jgi:hypothetical protein